MKASTPGFLLLSIAVLLAAPARCQRASDEPAAPAPSPETIPITRFEAAENGEQALIPFRKTGVLYVLETGCDCVLAITPAGKISIAVTKQQILDVTGAGRLSLTGKGVAVDTDGTLYFTEGETDSVLKKPRGGTLAILISGTALADALGQTEVDVQGLALDSAGMLYVTDNALDSVLRIDPTSASVTVLASGKDLGALVGLPTANLASSLAVGRGGVVFTTNEDDPQAIIGIGPAKGAGVMATSRLFEAMDGFMTVAADGSLVIMDTDAEVVFRIAPTGTVSTFLTEQQLQAPIDDQDGRYRGGIAFDSDDNLYVTEAHENHILRFDTSFQGSIWVSRAAIQTVTRTLPDLDGGIAFAPAE